MQEERPTRVGAAVGRGYDDFAYARRSSGSAAMPASTTSVDQSDSLPSVLSFDVMLIFFPLQNCEEHSRVPSAAQH